MFAADGSQKWTVCKAAFSLRLEGVNSKPDSGREFESSREKREEAGPIQGHSKDHFVPTVGLKLACENCMNCLDV